MLADSSKCTACNMCVNICPQNCIEMKVNEYGEMQPFIDENKCVNCNLCSNRCPVISPIKKEIVKRVYATVIKDNEQLKLSTSGGTISEIAKHIVKNEGIVYATIMTGLVAKFDRITNIEDLRLIAGSKYIHSRLDDNFKKIKMDLIDNRTVLVIGLPCHIAAIKAYLGKDYEKLFTIDLFCHGAPTAESLKAGLSFETDLPNISTVRFREGSTYKFVIQKKDGTKLEVPYRNNYWYNGFVEGYIFRECCYTCMYANEKRVGDISVGDFWGLGSIYKTNLDISLGVNAVLINNQKGQSLFDCVKNKINIELHSLDEVKEYNHPIKSPATKPKQYDKFKNMCKKYNFKKAILYAYPKKSVFIFTRRILSANPYLYNWLKKIPILSKKI